MERLIPLKMNWYYRTLLSYAPIFFVILSSLIFIYFTTLSSSSKYKYIETNTAILQQMVQYTDANLQLIERNVSKKIFTDEVFQSFFSDSPKTVYDYYLIQKNLIDFSSTFPFANSIYLFNEESGEFLTSSNKFSYDRFGDLAFFLSAYKEPGLQGWTGPREYRQADQQYPVKVVSLLKYFPYPSDKKGAVILNVHVHSILDELNRLNSNPGGASIVLLDGNDQPFQNGEASFQGRSLFAQSNYTGWQYYADGIYADKFTMLSLFSNIWIVFGLAVIVLAIVWFTVVTHFNYKPIMTIMDKIGPYTARRSEGIGIKSTSSELKLIEGAIDHLLEKTVDYDHIHNERKLLKQRSLYHDLLTGYRTLSEEEWAKQMGEFGLPHSYERLSVIVFEIDHYARFKERYSPSDQYLLKYIVENALIELMAQRHMYSWQVWVHPHQLAVAVHLQAANEPGGLLLRICEEYRDWINTNLELTLSSGIGETAASISQIEKSYRKASMNVSYKMVFGTNAIIDQTLTMEKAGGKKLDWYPALQETVHLYRANDPQWRDKLDEIIGGMQKSLAARGDIADFINQLTHHLQKQINSHSERIHSLWREEYAEAFRKLANTVETVDELHSRLSAILAKLANEIEDDRLSRSNHSIAVQIKNYIDQHYDDPDLSLNQVSHLFGVSPKNVSWFFKEELDIKFMDYVLKVRFDHAKRMLLETDEPIQHIAGKVGYTHVISFHRAFKKMFELPPGEYRNLYRS